MRKSYLLILIIYLYCFQTLAQKPLFIKGPIDYKLMEYLEIFEDTSQNQTFSVIAEKYNKGSFHVVSGISEALIQPDRVYWVHFEIFNSSRENLMWMLRFKSQISHIYLYHIIDKDFKNPSIFPSVTTNNISTNRLLISVPTNCRNEYFIKIKNQLQVEASVSKMTLSPKQEFLLQASNHGFLIGIVEGAMLVMFFFVFLLYENRRKREYIFYCLYLFFHAMFFLSGSFFTDMVLFKSNPWISYKFYILILAGHIFYIPFVREFISPENIPPKLDRWLFKPYIVIVVIWNVAISIIVFTNERMFNDLFNYGLTVYAVMALILSILLLRIKQKLVRFILIGTSIMILTGITSLLVGIFDLMEENHIYNTGVLIELLFITYALYYKQKLLDHEIQKTEQDLVMTKVILDSKHRELTQKVVYITKQEEILTGFKEKLLDIEDENPKTKKAILKILSDVDISLGQNSRNDFEKYFTEVHPDFYKKLKENFPGLSQHELRLCALIRLNLNTKQIADISNRTPKSIEVMRSRIRHKLGLSREENLFDALSEF